MNEKPILSESKPLSVMHNSKVSSTRIGFFVLISSLMGFADAVAAPLSIAEYLQQVKANNLGFQAQKKSEDSAQKSKLQSKLIFLPALDLQLMTGSNGAYPGQPGFEYDRINSNELSFGISQALPFGAQYKIGYSLFENEYENANFGGSNVEFNNWNSAPRLEVSIDLWRNFSGRSSRAEQLSSHHQNQSEALSAKAKRIEIVLQAQSTYWNLVATKKLVQIQTEAFQRSEDLLKFVQKKAGMDLREKSDVLQVRASLESSRLELRMARERERKATYDFNFLRGADVRTPVMELSTFENETESRVELPKIRPGEKIEIEIAKVQAELAKSLALVAEESYKPTLATFASFAGSGREETFGRASHQFIESGRNSYAIGVKMSFSLANDLTSKIREGARTRALAADLNFSHAIATQEHQWNELREKHLEALERQEIALQIQKAQQAKLQEEKRILRLGRSSLFNVLVFEQDYLRAQIGALQSALEVIVLNIESKLFSGVEI